MVRTSLLYDNAEVIEAMNKRKEALAKDVCPKGVRNLSCLSMKTMVNAVFKAVKERHGPSYVSTCTKRFPRFNLLMTEAGRRYGLHKIKHVCIKIYIQSLGNVQKMPSSRPALRKYTSLKMMNY